MMPFLNALIDNMKQKLISNEMHQTGSLGVYEHLMRGYEDVQNGRVMSGEEADARIRKAKGWSERRTTPPAQRN